MILILKSSKIHDLSISSSSVMQGVSPKRNSANRQWNINSGFPDSRSATSLGDTRRRGCARVRHRSSGQCLVLRQHRPELYTSRHLVRLLSGSPCEPLLSRFHVEQRHNERPDKLSLGGAEQRRDIQRRDEWPGQKSTHEIRRVPWNDQLPFADQCPLALPYPSHPALPPRRKQLMPVSASSGECLSVTHSAWNVPKMPPSDLPCSDNRWS